MSIDGLDGKCENCLTPQLKTYSVTGTVTMFIEAEDEDSALDIFDNTEHSGTFDDVEIDKI
tara:strand:- start:2376 stop:2558 length:183 start_codon:yes stop_codon:yes gene_type:complete